LQLEDITLCFIRVEDFAARVFLGLKHIDSFVSRGDTHAFGVENLRLLQFSVGFWDIDVMAAFGVVGVFDIWIVCLDVIFKVLGLGGTCRSLLLFLGVLPNSSEHMLLHEPWLFNPIVLALIWEVGLDE
jgi:hypothetical protein